MVPKMRAGAHGLVIFGHARSWGATGINVARAVQLAVHFRRGQCRLPIRRSSSKLCATLDLSRGLRVDKRNLPKAEPGIAEPVSPGLGPQPDSTLVFFGDPARVREGFAMALHAMGIGASIPDVVAHDPSEQGE
jgi:hypothetical protein